MNPSLGLGVAVVLMAAAFWSAAGAKTPKELGGPLFLLGIAGFVAAQTAGTMGAGWGLPIAGSLALLAYILFIGQDGAEEDSEQLSCQNQSEQSNSKNG